MAQIQVTKDTPQTFVDAANRDLIVTVTLTGIGFSVYVRFIERNFDTKIFRGTTQEFSVLRGDTVAAQACGTGVIDIQTRNA